MELGGPNYAKMAPKAEGGESVRCCGCNPDAPLPNCRSSPRRTFRQSCEEMHLVSGHAQPLTYQTAACTSTPIGSATPVAPTLSSQGMESQRGMGYKYFGAAKNLPGVKELFENQGPRTVSHRAALPRSSFTPCPRTGASRDAPRLNKRPQAPVQAARSFPPLPPSLSSGLCLIFSSRLLSVPSAHQVRRTRHQMNKAIDADYYGFRDEEDGVLDKVEQVVRAASAWLIRVLGPAQPM